MRLIGFEPLFGASEHLNVCRFERKRLVVLAVTGKPCSEWLFSLQYGNLQGIFLNSGHISRPSSTIALQFQWLIRRLP